MVVAAPATTVFGLSLTLRPPLPRFSSSSSDESSSSSSSLPSSSPAWPVAVAALGPVEAPPETEPEAGSTLAAAAEETAIKVDSSVGPDTPCSLIKGPPTVPLRLLSRAAAVVAEVTAVGE